MQYFDELLCGLLIYAIYASYLLGRQTTMRALGAQTSDIMGMFLAEALMIGIIGATAGLATGLAGGYVLTQTFSIGDIQAGAVGIQPVFVPFDLAYVWALSAILSLIAGIMPVWKASRLDPIKALQRN